jgi:hypothetical protein
MTYISTLSVNEKAERNSMDATINFQTGGNPFEKKLMHCDGFPCVENYRKIDIWGIGNASEILIEFRSTDDGGK